MNPILFESIAGFTLIIAVLFHVFIYRNITFVRESIESEAFQKYKKYLLQMNFQALCSLAFYLFGMLGAITPLMSEKSPLGLMMLTLFLVG